MLEKLKNAARSYPRTARLMKPILYPIIAIATRDNKEWINSQILRIFPHLKASGDRALELRHAADNNAAVGIGARASGQTILMLVVSDLRIDPRVEREARALAKAGYAVHIACPTPLPDPNARLEIDWGAGIRIHLLDYDSASFVSSFPGFIGSKFYLAANDIAIRVRPLAIHAHDLNTGYIGLAIARRTGAHLVADFHEWSSENVHWDVSEAKHLPYPPAWKSKLQALEARLMRTASIAITVCDSIAEAIARELGNGRRAEVIRNIPTLSAVPTKDYPPLKQQLGLPDDRFVLLWQGGTGPTRLIEPIIEALAFAPKCTFVIRGPSLDLYGQDYRSLAERVGAGDRLILQPAVPSRDVVAAARGADAGIWTLPALCRNFTYALPNKIFEYVAAGLPILVADYPEARRMVETHNVGLAFDPYSPESIAKAINRLIDDPAFAQSCRENTVTALAALDAEVEWQKLVTLYDGLPRTGAPAQ